MTAAHSTGDKPHSPDAMDPEDAYALVHIAWLMIIIFAVGVLLNLYVVLFHTPAAG